MTDQVDVQGGSVGTQYGGRFTQVVQLGEDLTL